MKAITISVAAQKGGAGKTTTAVNLASGLANRGHKVLLIDLEQQANATRISGYETYPRQTIPLTITDYLTRTDVDINEVIFSTNGHGYYLIGANKQLAGVAMGLAMTARQLEIRKAVHKIRGEFDFIIIDTPPGENYLTLNALTASEYALLTLQTDEDGLGAMSTTIEIIKSLQEGLNKNIKLLGMLPTLYYGRAAISKMILNDAKEMYGDLVLPFNVEYAAIYKEASWAQKTIYQYDPKYASLSAYEKLTEYIVNQLLPVGVDNE